MIFSTRENIQDISEKEVNTLAYTINQECINCAACDDSCPVGAISEAGDKRAIDESGCIDCGACVDTCPVGAIVPV
jgi:Fe-S-cluster-containing hydrogenase component 2